MKSFVTLLLLITISNSRAQPPVQVNAHIEGLPDGTLVLIQDFRNNDEEDFAIVKNSRFSFTKSLQEGRLYRLKAGKSASEDNISYIYLHPGSTITMKGKTPLLKDARLSGSPYILDWATIQHRINNDPEHIQWKKLFVELTGAIQMAQDTQALNKLQPDKEKLYTLSKKIVDDWIATHPASLINAHVIERYLYNLFINNVIVSAGEIENYLNKLPATLKNNVQAKTMLNGLQARKIVVGAAAPAFTQNDPNGRPVSLADFKGKYVLLDFWASWCGPCRAENPKVVAAFNKYKDKNFTILGISLDSNKDKWLEAIQKDQLTWTHVSDLKYWNNAVAQLYGIRGVPDNLLIDPKGIIVARGLRGEALEKKLQEIFQ